MEQKKLRGIILSDYEKKGLANNDYLETNGYDDTNYLRSLIMNYILETKNLKSKVEENETIKIKHKAEQTNLL